MVAKNALVWQQGQKLHPNPAPVKSDSPCQALANCPAPFSLKVELGLEPCQGHDINPRREWLWKTLNCRALIHEEDGCCYLNLTACLHVTVLDLLADDKASARPIFHRLFYMTVPQKYMSIEHYIYRFVILFLRLDRMRERRQYIGVRTYLHIQPERPLPIIAGKSHHVSTALQCQKRRQLKALKAALPPCGCLSLKVL